MRARAIDHGRRIQSAIAFRCSSGATTPIDTASFYGVQEPHLPERSSMTVPISMFASRRIAIRFHARVRATSASTNGLATFSCTRIRLMAVQRWRNFLRPAGREFGGAVDIGIVHGDDRVVAAQFEYGAFGKCRRPAISFPMATPPGEGDEVHVRSV